MTPSSTRNETQPLPRRDDPHADTGVGSLRRTGYRSTRKRWPGILAADPALSALKIDVSTDAGVVTLAGPAPDRKSRERAGLLAAASNGVRRVDNRLVVSVRSPSNS